MTDGSATDPVAAAVLLLARHLGDHLDRAGMTDHRAELDRLGAGDVVRPVRGSVAPLPVLAHLPRAVEDAGRLLPAATADALAYAAGAAAWTQTAAYVTDPPSPGFLDGYAHATLAGPPDGGPGGPGTTRAEDREPPPVALGLVLLGPEAVYPHHAHPADEVYLPLTLARWSAATAEPPTERPAGALLHHRPHQPHAMTTDEGPLLALYLWTGEVTRAAEWVSRGTDVPSLLPPDPAGPG